MSGLSPARSFGKILAVVSALTLGGGLVAYRQWSAMKAAEPETGRPEPAQEQAESKPDMRKAILSSSKRMTAAVTPDDLRFGGRTALPSSKSGVAIRQQDLAGGHVLPASGWWAAQTDPQAVAQSSGKTSEAADLAGFRITPTTDKEYRIFYVVTDTSLEKTSPDTASFEIHLGKNGDWTVTPPEAAARLTDALRQTIAKRHASSDFSPAYSVIEIPAAAGTRRGTVLEGLPSSKSGPMIIFEFEADEAGHIRLREKGGSRRFEAESTDAVRAHLKAAPKSTETPEPGAGKR